MLEIKGYDKMISELIADLNESNKEFIPGTHVFMGDEIDGNCECNMVTVETGDFYDGGEFTIMFIIKTNPETGVTEYRGNDDTTDRYEYFTTFDEMINFIESDEFKKWVMELAEITKNDKDVYFDGCFHYRKHMKNKIY